MTLYNTGVLPASGIECINAAHFFSGAGSGNIFSKKNSYRDLRKVFVKVL